MSSVAREPASWRLFIETSARLHTLLDEELRAHCGMSLSDYHILLILQECPEQRARMRDLSRRMVFSTSRLSYQIDVMVKRGWLRRESAPEDRRGSYAVVTEAGRQAFAAAARDHGEAVTRLFSTALSPADDRRLASIMETLTHHLDDLSDSETS
ncbi:MarR family transcriptional regulator [Gordonia sp. VNQ95]|uniref:MarR family winged helix-turn-helix transcriptional regulator n=1 Tax=Gordonia sp. VNQ95 TaxID=3156619 RepID=UPI0032B50C26